MKIISKITALITRESEPGTAPDPTAAPVTVTLRPSSLPVEVPDWVRDTDHFKLGLKDGSFFEATEYRDTDQVKAEVLSRVSAEELIGELSLRGVLNKADLLKTLTDDDLYAELSRREDGSASQRYTAWTDTGDGKAYPKPAGSPAPTAIDDAAGKAAAAARAGKGGAPAKGKAAEPQAPTASDKTVEQKEADKGNLENAGKAGTDSGTPSGSQAVNSGDARTSRPEAAGGAAS